MPCPKIAEGQVVRLTRVDGCGAPVCGDNAIVDDCWASVQMTANVEDGQDITFKSMSGRSCGFKRGCPDFRGFDITGTFYSASPELVEILTGNPVVFDYNGNPVGWRDCSVQCNSGFALEVWANVVGEECAEDAAADGLWAYLLLPWITNARLGDLTIGSEGVTFTVTGNTRSNGRWGVGPWPVVAQDAANTPGPLLTPMEGDCHRHFELTSVEPPVAECGYVAVEGDVCVSPSESA